MKTQRRDMREVMRDEMIMKDPILALLKEETKTVAEVSEALRTPTEETMFWMIPS